MNDQARQNTLKHVAQRAVDGALKRGVKGVRALSSRSRSVSLTYRDRRPEKVEESTQQGLTLHLYNDGQYTSCETNDLRDTAVDAFLDSAVAMVKAMSKDPYRLMPDPSLYEGREECDLQLFDPAVEQVTPQNRHDFAKRLEDAAIKKAGDRLITVEANYDDTEGEYYKLHSNGFEGYVEGTQFWGYTEISLKDDGDRRPSGYAVGGSRKRAALASPEDIAQRAADSALAKLGAEKIPTARMPMIIENRAVSTMLSYLLRGLSARALQQKASFLDGKIGEQLASPLLDLKDDPFIPGGFGSRLFDAEGISAKPMPLFEGGALRNYFIDTYYGRKLGLKPTTGASSNLVLTPGTKSLDQLCAEVGTGILVRGFLGGNSNTTTGDFSLGVYGTLIENGKPTRAVSEINIADNHLEFWKRLVSVGNDPYTYSSVIVPSIVFDDVQFAGS